MCVIFIANEITQNLRRLKNPQSVVISGESGAGKTENSKLLLKSLCYMSKDNNSVFDKILASNLILEAFGNSVTIQNANSSRFAKYIQV